MNYLSVHYQDPAKRGINVRTVITETMTFHDWLKTFNPKARVYMYALSAFNEGNDFDEVLESCEEAFNDINSNDRYVVCMNAYKRYKQINLN